VAGGWRKLDIEDHHNFVGKPEGKRPLGSSRHEWEDNISMHLREIGWENVD
jgi:hypothetical protein